MALSEAQVAALQRRVDTLNAEARTRYERKHAEWEKLRDHQQDPGVTPVPLPAEPMPPIPETVESYLQRMAANAVPPSHLNE